jgi:aminocarboxymuconate-semialdehyde decarboxylase
VQHRHGTAGKVKIDVHTHILPENWPDLKEKYGYGGFVNLQHTDACSARMMVDGTLFREVQSNCWDPKVRIEDCDRTKVDIQVLSTVPIMFSYWAKPEHTYDLSKFLNDHIVSVVENHPGRFVGLGTVPLQSPNLAIKEMERCMSELGLVGVEIGTHVNGWNLNDENLFPFFQAAEELNAAIFIHPWDMRGKEKMPLYWLPWLVGMPAETSLAICSMIFGAVFERLPMLKVCFAHGGGSFPFTIGRIEQGFKVRPDLTQIHSKVNPREFLGRFYLDSLVHDELALKYLVQLIGEDRVVLGSDYPFPLGEHHPGKLIESMSEFNPQVKEKLLWKNAADFIGIEKFYKIAGDRSC